jgi:membrane-bound serine protease (ClpP class)
MSGATGRLLLAGVLFVAAAAPAKDSAPAKDPAPAQDPPSAAQPDDGAAREEKGAARPARIVRLVVDGGINPATADYVRDGLRAAQALGAQALLIQMDTPGGLLDSTKTIVKDILGAPLPVIIYVAPSGGGAISAGVFITLAGHVTAMAPGTNIGAAHPVGGQGESIEGDMGEKVENFAASLSRTIAQQRGRNVEWAEKAVRESVSITEREAVELNVVDLVADDTEDLLAKIDGREVDVNGRKVVLATAAAVVEEHEMRLRQRILDIIANPNLAYLLMMAGILGLYVEFTNPGLLFPGVAGAICLLLAMSALQVLPINYTGLALIGLGIALLVAEIFLPSFGVLGVGGLVAFVLGSLLLFDTPESTLTLDRRLVFATAATLGTFVLAIGWLVVSAQRQRASVGVEAMIGEVGEVRRLVDSAGRLKVFVHGEYWDAESQEALQVGDPVEVVKVEGMRVHVRRHA